MVTPDEEEDHYVKDPRMPCKFGIKCYQKNSPHHEKYKHPPKKRTLKDGGLNESSSKKRRSSEGHSSNDTKKETEAQVESEASKQQGDLNESAYEKQRTSEGHSSNDTDNSETEAPKQIESETPKQYTTEKFDEKLFIKDKFLFEMPNDFYSFWDFCKSIKKDDPSKAFAGVGLLLVGPYDVLAGKFSNVAEKSVDDYLIHWRYYYDPPELQTIIKGSDATQYHIGYFRDDPSELPVFLASNHAKTNGEFNCMGENIFAAVNIFLEESKKSCDPFKKIELSRLQVRLKERAEELKLDLSEKTESIKKRNNKILSRTFNKLGLVVPYEKKTQLGYRHLCVSDKELKKLLDRIVDASDVQRSKVMSEFQPILTATSIATDECDFGTGIELGWDILAHGVDSLNTTIERFLTNSYRLIKRDEFAKIVSAHMKNRKNGSNLSIL